MGFSDASIVVPNPPLTNPQDKPLGPRQPTEETTRPTYEELEQKLKDAHFAVEHEKKSTGTVAFLLFLVLVVCFIFFVGFIRLGYIRDGYKRELDRYVAAELAHKATLTTIRRDGLPVMQLIDVVDFQNAQFRKEFSDPSLRFEEHIVLLAR